MNEDQLALFIMSHGRADRCFTMAALERHGWTGPTFIIIDDEDAQAGAYRERYGERVIQFNKREVAERVDVADNFPGRHSIVFARHACYDVARQLGFRYFGQFDDDYNRFQWRFDSQRFYTTKKISDLDAVLAALLDYYKDIPAASIAIGQGGDFLGGQLNEVYAHAIVLARKAMNSFLCDVERPIAFAGRLNDDVTAYSDLQRRGELFFSYMGCTLNQHESGQSEGGMSASYQESGWYKKAMYSVIQCPSGVYVRDMGLSGRRIHHRLIWDAVTPRVLHEKWRKTA